MKIIGFLFIFSAVIYCTESWDRGFFLGCFKEIPFLYNVVSEQYKPRSTCVEECTQKYFRYTLIYSSDSSNNGQCNCGNYLGEEVSNTTCLNYCRNSCDLKPNLTDIYATGNLVPGPPRNLKISNITETGLHIAWSEPESFITVLAYQIKANVLHTYSSYPLVNPEWMYSNNTFQTELISLLPATRYNITVCVKAPEGYGALVAQVMETKIGEPDTLPVQPKILRRSSTEMDLALNATTNNNGPITTYQIIVVNQDDKQGFQIDHVLPYDEARRSGFTYYITAEIQPEDINKTFTVGDGRYYGKYYNAPLDPSINYNVLLGLVSSFKEVTKVAYSRESGNYDGTIVFNVSENDEDDPSVIIGLSIAIGLLSFMLIAGIIGFIILKSRVTNRRQRLSDNQELTLQGPMIEVENNGYIHEEDQIPVNHYMNLKQKVKTISSSNLKIEPTNLLGIGKFGRVNSGTLSEHNTLIPVAVYSIADRKMSQDTRKCMLQELDLLIRTGKHENIIGLIGTCETQQVVSVIMEYVSMNLKDLLLGSRDALPGRFSNMSEVQALDIAIQICQGMAHLESCKIIHKQICARSVMITNGFTPKISSYGLAQYFSHNKIPDYTRWTALEVFRNQTHNPKSDVWSFACLLWEICVLGGTPYGNVPNNNEVPGRIIKGLRLPQMQYFSDELYQIMLDCWQVDPDERPTFINLVESLIELKNNWVVPHLNFKLYSNFQYEQFHPDMELAARPVF